MPRRVREFSLERDRELLDTYRECLDKEPYPARLENVVLKTINSPCSRFWVSPERAYDVIHTLEKGGNSGVLGKVRLQMFQEIYRRVKLLRLQHPTMSLYALTEEVVFSPAPKFYLSLKSALVIIHKIKKKKCLESSKQRLRFMS